MSRSGPREPEAPSEEKLAPWSDQIYQWLTQDQLQFTMIQELLAERDYRVSYSSRHRWLSRRHWQRRRSAAEQGPAVAEFAERLFDGPLPWAKVRQGHKLIRLGQRHTPERLDSASRRTWRWT